MRELIAALYEPGVPLPTDPSYYAELERSGDLTDIAGSLYRLLDESGRLEEVPSFFRERLQDSFDANMGLTLYLQHELNRILCLLEANEIPVIPLKGVLFARAYYGHPAARSTSDIDVLIRREDVERVKAFLVELGFEPESTSASSHFHVSCSRPLPFSHIPLVVELHWDILWRGTSSLPVDYFWGRAERLPGFQHVQILSDEDTLYMICLHGWRHRLDSWKYILDILQVLRRIGGGLNMQHLLQSARTHGTYKRLVWALQSAAIIVPSLTSTAGWPSERLPRIGSPLLIHVLLYDRGTHARAALRQWIFPEADVLLLELGPRMQGRSKPVQYALLTWKRIRRLVKDRMNGK